MRGIDPILARLIVHLCFPNSLKITSTNLKARLRLPAKGGAGGVSYLEPACPEPVEGSPVP